MRGGRNAIDPFSSGVAHAGQSRASLRLLGSGGRAGRWLYCGTDGTIYSTMAVTFGWWLRC